MSARLHIVVSVGLRDRIDGALGPGQSRGDWVRRVLERELDRGESNRRAVEQALSEAKEPVDGSRAAPAPFPESRRDVRPPAPAERPERSVRAAREFRPYPKGGER